MHQKKISVLAAAIFFISSGLFATGAGVQAGVNPGLYFDDNSVSLEKVTGNLYGTMRFSRVPLVVGFGFEAGKLFSDFSYGLAGFANYYALDIQLKNTFNFYSGLGAGASLLTPDFENYTVSANGRLFIGLNCLFYDNYLELFVQQNLIPCYVQPLKNESKGAFMLDFPLEAGIRMHF